MSALTPMNPELLAAFFEDALFPAWLVEEHLAVIHCNKAARRQYPAHCMTDGIRLFLTPQSADQAEQAILAGHSFSTLPSMTAHPGAELAFTPFVDLAGHQVSMVLLAGLELHAPSPSDNPRKAMSGAENLMITQALRRCLSDLFAALATASARLRDANLTLLDDQLRQMNHSCYQLMRTAGNLTEQIQLADGLPAGSRPVDFWENCAQLLSACSTLLGQQHLNFEYTLPASTVAVDCNFAKLTTVLLNLLSNAYLHGGKDVQVTVTGRDLDARGLLVTVTDNGPGIPDEVQARLFQPFSSLDTLDMQTAGMGLGLHLARKLLAEAGGTLTLDTGAGGTTVALHLPQAGAPLGPLELGSTDTGYLQDRFSPVYVGLCDMITLPEP